MKTRRLILLTFCFFASVQAFAQTYTLSGVVSDRESGDPVEFAAVAIEATGQWATADAKGRFFICGIGAGTVQVKVYCLGYVTWQREIKISRDITNFSVALSQDNLALESAVVTAQENSSSATTSRKIDRAALEQVQMLNVSDIASLLPGGTTVNPDLTGSGGQIAIRSATSGEGGNSTFGTAVEVDGVRLSSNASFAGADRSSTNLKGISTNSIASSNVESVEVITGVPSVEYGDMTSGVVKINTKRGKTPFTVTMTTSPKTKQISFSKGFGLGTDGRGRSRGSLTTSAEYTRSISVQMSPYTSYERKQVSLNWNNTLRGGLFEKMPLSVNASLTGNAGGLDNRADPDRSTEAYTTARDNSLRGSLAFNWLLSRSWITSIELKASAVYSDKLSRENTSVFGTTAQAALHTTERGYLFADRIPAGQWYNMMVLDDKPFNSKVSLKANWARSFAGVRNRVKAGADYTADRNYGKGQYSEDMSTAPTYRPYDYSLVPAMHNVAAYVEDDAMLPVGRDGQLNLVAGVRYDNTIIRGSAYGTTRSLSPRFNARYSPFSKKRRRGRTLRDFSVRASWGQAVKQPSYSILFPQPTYNDIKVFTSTAGSINEVYSAYYVLPRTIEYNSALRWQRNRQAEVGVDFDLAGHKVSLAAFMSKTLDAYRLVADYERFSYAYTSADAIKNSEGAAAIAAADRIFSVDPSSGAITVSDRSGANPAVTLPYRQMDGFTASYYEDNDDNPIVRRGFEYVVDFKRIKSLNTQIRLDGSYYTYKQVYTDYMPYVPTSQMGYDRTPLKYVGYYVGGSQTSNGRQTRSLNTNVTLTTNIPKVRMVVSLKLEACLLRYSRTLSETADGGRRSYVIADRSDLTSRVEDASIYDGDCYTVLYPDKYFSYSDGQLRDFWPDFVEAKSSDPQKYSDMVSLVQTTSYNYTFKESRITPYFSANFNVTKEIGDMASISFYANNFFNNMSQLYDSRTGNYVSVTSYIPKFYYGLTVRLKF